MLITVSSLRTRALPRDPRCRTSSERRRRRSRRSAVSAWRECSTAAAAAAAPPSPGRARRPQTPTKSGNPRPRPGWAPAPPPRPPRRMSFRRCRRFPPLRLCWGLQRARHYPSASSLATRLCLRGPIRSSIESPGLGHGSHLPRPSNPAGNGTPNPGHHQ